jgi:hypothetical protein
MKLTMMLHKAVASWVGDRGHHQGAIGRHHPHHDNAPPAVTIVDHSKTCRRVIFIERSMKGTMLALSSTPDEKSELQLVATLYQMTVIASQR